MSKLKRDLYFIGFGNMAQAIYQRMDQSVYENIFLVEKSSQRIKEIKKMDSIDSGEFFLSHHTKIIKKLSKNEVTDSDIILLAVKPTQIKSVCTQIKGFSKFAFVISIAAGVNTSKIIKYLDYPTDRIARTMPNLCAKKGMAITGIFYDGRNNSIKKTAHGSMISKIFTSIGQVLWVEHESDLDSITAISGSGPAYIYYIMNAMIDAAVEIGLKRSDAQRLVAQTIIGAGETGKNIDNLGSEIIKVSSKGGTTEKAISIFKQKKLDTIIKQAVKAAHKRSKELSK